MKPKLFILLTLAAFAGATSAFAGATFTPTGAEMIPTSMSDDASIVVGTGFYGAPNLYYTEAAGVSVIGDGCSNGLPAISGDGGTVLGCHVDGNGNENAAKWLSDTSWLDLGSEAGAVPCGTSLSGAYGVNQDGSVGVGLLWRAQVCHANAGTWDLVNGGPATVLPTLFDGPSSRANAVNADGSVIVGWQDQPNGERSAAKWVDGTPELILTAAGELNGEAQAVSADGKTIVGGGYAFGHSAWVWHEGEDVSEIGGGAQARRIGSYVALDVSDDGQTIVGFIHGGRFKERAFFWRGHKGVRLDTFLANQGAVVPEGWTLEVASIISADGKTIYGWGFNPADQLEMFKVTLDAPK